MAEHRTFESGATRNAADHKHDFEGFISVPALRAYGAYMHGHRALADGSQRDSDNWQQGIPLDAYMKSLLRHVIDVWELHRGGAPINPDNGELVTMDEALCGVLFNAFGYLHETVKPVS